MKRLHVHISVEDLAAARRFYTALLGAEPTVVKPDYAKWLLDDPRVNLAISERACGQPGISHLGVQAESAQEFDELHGRLSKAEYGTLEEKAANCCYARSDKHWALDPVGVPWEIFHTLGAAETYGEDRVSAPEVRAALAPKA